MPTEVVNKRCVWNAWLLWHCVADCFTEWAGLVHGCGAVWLSEPMEVPLIPFCLHGDGDTPTGSTCWDTLGDIILWHTPWKHMLIYFCVICLWDILVCWDALCVRHTHWKHMLRYFVWYPCETYPLEALGLQAWSLEVPRAHINLFLEYLGELKQRYFWEIRLRDNIEW